MPNDTEDRWKLLCEEAATENDARRLIELLQEINDLLEARRLRLRTQRAGNESSDTAAA
jgi:uncharacterized protein with von Willebrand factor type A (vWA) domain